MNWCCAGVGWVSMLPLEWLRNYGTQCNHPAQGLTRWTAVGQTSGCSAVQQTCCSPDGSLVLHSPVYSDQSIEKRWNGTDISCQVPGAEPSSWKLALKALPPCRLGRGRCAPAAPNATLKPA